MPLLACWNAHSRELKRSLLISPCHGVIFRNRTHANVTRENFPSPTEWLRLVIIQTPQRRIIKRANKHGGQTNRPAQRLSKPFAKRGENYDTYPRKGYRLPMVKVCRGCRKAPKSVRKK